MLKRERSIGHVIGVLVGAIVAGAVIIPTARTSTQGRPVVYVEDYGTYCVYTTHEGGFWMLKKTRAEKPEIAVVSPAPLPPLLPCPGWNFASRRLRGWR